MFSVILLGSCSKCYKCKQKGNTSVNFSNPDNDTTIIFDVCESDFNSKDEWKQYIQDFEENPIRFTDNSGNIIYEGENKCRRKLF